MPFEHFFRLKYPYDLPELLGRAVGMPFEFIEQNSRNQFFCAVGLEGFVLFPGYDVELVGEAKISRSLSAADLRPRPIILNKAAKRCVRLNQPMN
jgi:hypothetical protein